MLEINKRFGQFRRKMAIIMLAGLLWLVSIPAASVQAAGYFSGDYSTKDSVWQKGGGKAYAKREIDSENYLKSRKHAGEQSNNLQTQRRGSKYYDRGSLEKERERNR